MNTEKIKAICCILTASRLINETNPKAQPKEVYLLRSRLASDAIDMTYPEATLLNELAAIKDPSQSLTHRLLGNFDRVHIVPDGKPCKEKNKRQVLRVKRWGRGVYTRVMSGLEAIVFEALPVTKLKDIHALLSFISPLFDEVPDVDLRQQMVTFAAGISYLVESGQKGANLTIEALARLNSEPQPRS